MRKKVNQENFYEGLGRFVIEFEFLMEMIRLFIAECGEKIQCSTRRVPSTKKAIEGMISNYPSGRLVGLIGPTFQLAFPSQIFARNAIEELIRKLEKLVEDRNHIIHGFYVSGTPDEDGSFIIKKKLHKEYGVRPRIKELNSELLGQFLTYMDSLSSIFNLLCRGIGSERKICKALYNRLPETPPTLAGLIPGTIKTVKIR